MQEENQEDKKNIDLNVGKKQEQSVQGNEDKIDTTSIYPDAKPEAERKQFNGVLNYENPAPSSLMALKPIIIIFILLAISSYLLTRINTYLIVFYYLFPLLFASLFSFLLLIRKNFIRIVVIIAMFLSVAASSYLLYMGISLQIGLNKKQADLSRKINTYNEAALNSGLWNQRNQAYENLDKASQNTTDYLNGTYLTSNIIGSFYILYTLLIFIYLLRPNVAKYYKTGKKED